MNRYLCIWDYMFAHTVCKIVNAYTYKDAISIFINNVESKTGLIVDNDEVLIADIENIDLSNIETIGDGFYD